jgi:sulfite dehydrogenase (quinone) subunit SoeC
MHPAYSVILFTTLSGAGYGLLALLGLLGPAGLLPPERWFGLAALGLALAAISAGLLASTVHLGRPERAWRAVSQWRSSWLSREGVAALATYPPAGLYALGWVVLERNSGVWGLLGLLTAALAIVTVYCTAMIYVSLRPIQRWANRWVLPNYLALALLTGALWLHLLVRLVAAPPPVVPGLAVAAILLAWPLKLGYWRFIDRTQSASTPESATGLTGLGQVRLFEAPHSQDNYLLREMGYRIARKHAARLRRIAAGLAFALPLALTLAALALPGAAAVAAALGAALGATAGVLIERWLFFAEARHTVTLYYGQDAA